MSEVILPERVKRAVAKGRVLKGVREYAEQRPDGSWEMKIGPASPVEYRPWVDADGNRHVMALTSDEAKPISIPHSEVERMRASLPPVIRRTARERYAQLVRILYDDGLKQFTADGQVRWPASVERELAVIGAAEGRKGLVAQVEALAGRFIVRAARQQQEQDDKRVARGWHGHLSA